MEYEYMVYDMTKFLYGSLIKNFKIILNWNLKLKWLLKFKFKNIKIKNTKNLIKT